MREMIEAAKLYERQPLAQRRTTTPRIRNGAIGQAGIQIIEFLARVIDYSTGALFPSLHTIMDGTGSARIASFRRFRVSKTRELSTGSGATSRFSTTKRKALARASSRPRTPIASSSPPSSRKSSLAAVAASRPIQPPLANNIARSRRRATWSA
jgi:hypothetical protein